MNEKTSNIVKIKHALNINLALWLQDGTREMLLKEVFEAELWFKNPIAQNLQHTHTIFFKTMATFA